HRGGRGRRADADRCQGRAVLARRADQRAGRRRRGGGAREPPGPRGRGTGQSVPGRWPGTRGFRAHWGGSPVKTILVAGGVSLLLALLGTPLAIKIFSRRGYGQLIREEGPAAHMTKRGTPTMGSTVIVIASLIGYFVADLVTRQPMSTSGLLVLDLMTGLGLVGFIDDFIKIYRETSLGLRSGAKLAGQSVIGAIFAVEVLHYPDGYGLTPADAQLSFVRDFGPLLGVLPFVLWIVIMIGGASNAVNLTDGLDGLATGAAILVL